MWSRYCTQWTVLGLEKKKKKPEQTWRAPQPNWISEQNAGKDSILLWCQNQTFYPRGCRDLEDGGTTWKKKGFASTCLVGSSRLKTQKKKRSHCGHSVRVGPFVYVLIHFSMHEVQICVYGSRRIAFTWSLYSITRLCDRYFQPLT